jgi:hypothetical protein
MVPVILLVDSSTAGKPSICNSPAFEKFTKSGTDLAYHNPIMLSKAICSILEHMELSFNNPKAIK